jgi:hypothetical protein
MSTPKELLDACDPPAWVYERLRESLDARRIHRRSAGVKILEWLSRWRWQGAALALTALFSLAWILDSQLAGPDPVSGQFMAVTELGAFPADDEVWLVAAELPQQQLAAMGLPFDPARAGERVPTQVLLRANGELLAVRLDH